MSVRNAVETMQRGMVLNGEHFFEVTRRHGEGVAIVLAEEIGLPQE